jgi:hypothetical protein
MSRSLPLSFMSRSNNKSLAFFVLLRHENSN